MFLSFFCQLGSDFVLGRPRTEAFVPRFLLLPGTKAHRDKNSVLSWFLMTFQNFPVPLDTLPYNVLWRGSCQKWFLDGI